jgi:TolB protein
MRPAFLAFLAAGLLLLPFSARAQEEEVPITGAFTGGLEGEPVTVNIAPSSRMLDPVAIPEAVCRCSPAHCKAVHDTLNRDLTLSAFFTVLDKRSYLADPSSEDLKVSKWDDWFNIGAKYLVKASLEGSGDTCTLTFRLYDVSLRKYMEVKDSDPGPVPAAKLVPATHAFVNALIEAITGVPGIFGNFLVYSARTGKGSRAVYQIGVDGRDKAVMAGGGTLNLFPSLANGSLVYTSFRTGSPEVYVNGKRVTRGGKQYRGARLSPDGGLLAASADNGSGQSELYLLSKDGKLIKELTDTPWDEVSPVWSYDGSMVAFVSNRTGGPQVYVMDRDGGSVRRVTMAGGYNSTPDFGPDNRIVFAGMDEARSDIFVTDLEGNITRITQDQGNNKDPAFSPDGRYIAFVSNRDGGWKIYLSTSDGRYQFPITDTTGGYSTLFWVR